MLQAKLHMWVDILPVHPPPPPPLDISPPPARSLVLSLNVDRLYDVQAVDAANTSLLARAYVDMQARRNPSSPMTLTYTDLLIAPGG